MLGMPNLDGLVAGFQTDTGVIKTELAAIRTLLEQLLQLEINNNKGEQ